MKDAQNSSMVPVLPLIFTRLLVDKSTQSEALAGYPSGSVDWARRVTIPRGMWLEEPLPYRIALSSARPTLSESISTIQLARAMSLSSSRLLHTGMYPATL